MARLRVQQIDPLAEIGRAQAIVKALDEKDEAGGWRVKPDSIRESLLANLGRLDKALRLVTLRTDAPIESAFDELDLLSTSLLGKISKAERTEDSLPSPSSPPPDKRPPRRPEPAQRATSTVSERAAEPARVQQLGQSSEFPTALDLLRRVAPYLAHSDQLAGALSAAQGAMPHAEKDSKNPHFGNRYADLASVIDACRAPLAAHGLSVVQLPAIIDRGRSRWGALTVDTLTSARRTGTSPRSPNGRGESTPHLAEGHLDQRLAVSADAQ